MTRKLGVVLTVIAILGLAGPVMAVSMRSSQAQPRTAVTGDPFLTLVKEVVNLAGGTATPSDFTLMAIGPVTISGPGNSAAVRNQPVPNGIYQLRESGPVGYSPSVWECFGTFVSATTNSVTLGTGDNATCGITNTFVAPPTTTTTTTVPVTTTTTIPATSTTSTTIPPSTTSTTTTTTTTVATTTTTSGPPTETTTTSSIPVETTTTIADVPVAAPVSVLEPSLAVTG